MKTFTVKDIILAVKEDNEFLKQYGLPKALPCALVSLTTEPGFDGQVYVSSAFFNLSEESQKTILTHEAGHIACNHLEIACDGLLINEDVEAEADAWADNVLGEGTFDKFIDEQELYLINLLLEKGNLTQETEAAIRNDCAKRKRNRIEWIAKHKS